MQNIERTVMKDKPKTIVFAILAVISLVLGFSLITFSFNIKKTKDIELLKYSPEINNNYSVNLKDNSYFTSSTLEENGEYIASAIDNVDIDYDYNLNLTKKVNGSYNYKIIATIKAYTKNESNEAKEVWTKDFILKEEKNVPFKNKDNINIKENVKINYDEYNDIINNFKKDYMLSVTSKLDIVLDMSVNGAYNKKTFNSRSLSSVSMPLATQTMGITKQNTEKKEYSLTDTIVVKKFNNIMLSVSGIIFVIISLYVLYMQISKIIADDKLQSEYLKKKKKYLHDYDDIIASVKTKPDLKNLKLIEFENFDELVNAQMDIRVPIIFYENKKNELGYFYLISQDFAYYFVLKNNDKVKNEKK